MFAQYGSSPRRVVVTGMGIACPLGLGVENVWRRMLAGESGIRAIQSFDVANLPAKLAGIVPTGTRADAGPGTGMDAARQLRSRSGITSISVEMPSSSSTGRSMAARSGALKLIRTSPAGR